MNCIYGYIAVDGNGDFFIYKNKPTRNEKDVVWDGPYWTCVGFRFSEMGESLEDIPEDYRNMTWEDEPRKIEIYITLKPY